MCHRVVALGDGGMKFWDGLGSWNLERAGELPSLGSGPLWTRVVALLLLLLLLMMICLFVCEGSRSKHRATGASVRIKGRVS